MRQARGLVEPGAGLVRQTPAGCGRRLGKLAGIAGAVIGTLAGHAFRAQLAQALGRDRPAALIEDAAAYAGALLIIVLLP